MINPHPIGTAAWLIFELQALPPETIINVPTAYAWSPAPVIRLEPYHRTSSIVLDNGQD
jgi:hypothetical protein